MKDSEKNEFAQLLTDVMAYYRQDVSPFVLGLWWSACRGFDLAQVGAAMQRHCVDPERGQFAPKVADLARILQGTTTDRAALAWGKAIDAAGRVGAYADVVFDDAAIHAAIEDLGGWPKFCRGETKDLSYQQHRFQQSYMAYADRGEFDYPRRLSGDRSSDDVFAKRGLPPPKPAVVGVVERARVVYRGGVAGGKSAIAFTAVEALERPCAPVLMPAQVKAAA